MGHRLKLGVNLQAIANFDRVMALNQTVVSKHLALKTPLSHGIYLQIAQCAGRSVILHHLDIHHQNNSIYKLSHVIHAIALGYLSFLMPATKNHFTSIG